MRFGLRTILLLTTTLVVAAFHSFSQTTHQYEIVTHILQFRVAMNGCSMCDLTMPAAFGSLLLKGCWISTSKFL